MGFIILAQIIGDMRYVLIFLLFLPSVGRTQIIIDENDFPSEDDTIRVGSCSVQGFDGDDTGTNFIWDFSFLEASYQRVDTFVSVFSTLVAYNIIFNPLVANLASPTATPPASFPGLTITDTYDFYKLDNDYYRKAGFGAKINGVPTPVKYDDPELILSLNAGYGDQDSSVSFFGIPVPTIGYFGQTIQRKYTVDGWGTLILPYGTFSVLRIKYEVLTSDTIYSEGLGFGYTIHRPMSEEYHWMAKGMDIPLLTISKTGMMHSATFRDSIFYTGLQQNSIALVSTVKVFPNPFSGEVLISHQGCPGDFWVFRLLDISGQELICGISDAQSESLDISYLSPGIYMVEITAGNQKSVLRVVKER